MAINFDFPQWMLRQNTFADSLAKGAQVGAAIANARYRNQALAAQAVQSEREFALREKQLAAHNRTADLNYQLQSQLIQDQSNDKAVITDWISKRNQLPMEERLSMDLPALRLAQSYEVVNKIADNDRMVYERSVIGQSNAARAKIFGAVPEFAEDFFSTADPEERREILRRAREQYVKQQPATIAAESRLNVAEMNATSRENIAKFKAGTQESLVKLRGQINMLRDQAKLEGQFDLEAERQAGRLEVMQLKFDKLATMQEDSQEFKKEFETLQNDLRIERDASKAALKVEAEAAKKYGVTEASFVSRNLKTILEALETEKAHKKATIEEKTKLATSILQKAYRDSSVTNAPAPSTGSAPASTPAPPTVGEVRSGFRYKGGDPGLQTSWEPIIQDEPPAPMIE